MSSRHLRSEEPMARAHGRTSPTLRSPSRTVAWQARSLRLLRGGTAEPRDEARTPTPRPSLTLLERAAVMPSSAWRAVHGAAAAHRGERGAPSLEVRSANDAPTITPSAPSELLDGE